MKYTIDGKPAYLVAKENGVNWHTFFTRIYAGMPIDKAATCPLRKRHGYNGYRYIIIKDREYIKTCFSTQQVAKYLGTSKGTICGLFYRQGDKIELFGYTVKRRGQRENKTGANL